MLLNFENNTLDFSIDAPPSKSLYHRELIVRFLFGDTAHLEPLEDDSDDVLATKACLKAMLSARAGSKSGEIILPCNESGSTLRFMIPVAAAYLLGINPIPGLRLIFETQGRLYDRPIKELSDALLQHGIIIEKNDNNRTIEVYGRMTPGEYIIGGSVSSQYISGLLMALSIFDEACSVIVMGEIKSIHYIELTQTVLEKYGAPVRLSENTYFPSVWDAAEAKALLGDLNTLDFSVEGDWSNGAFLLCLKEFTDISVGNLNPDSGQGDVMILKFLEAVSLAKNKLEQASAGSAGLTEDTFWDCNDIPDIAPYMAVTSAFFFRHATFAGIERLHIKESDRVKAVREQLAAIGIKTEETENTLTVYGAPLSEISQKAVSPIKLSSYHDHRMAMCAILIGAALKKDVELDDPDCLKKSFPQLLTIISELAKTE